MLGSSFQQCQVQSHMYDLGQVDREQTSLYSVQLAHRGRGDKKKERRLGVELTNRTGKTERQKSPTSIETEAENWCEIL